MRSIKDTLLVIKNAVEQFSAETKKEVSLALIGGHAVIYFGVERTTLDVDICLYLPDKSPGVILYDFLKRSLPGQFNPRLYQASTDPSDPLKHDLIIIDDLKGEYPRVDILIARYRWELAGLGKATISSGFSFPIMPLPYLITMKLMAGGRKDELDIIEMLKGIPEDDLKKAVELAGIVRKNKKLQLLLKESRK